MPKLSNAQVMFSHVIVKNILYKNEMPTSNSYGWHFVPTTPFGSLLLVVDDVWCHFDVVSLRSNQEFDFIVGRLDDIIIGADIYSLCDCIFYLQHITGISCYIGERK